MSSKMTTPTFNYVDHSTPASFADAVERCNPLFEEGFGQTWCDARPEDVICFVILDGIVVSAFALMTEDREVYKFCCFTTHPDYRGRGFGSLCVEEAKRFAKSEGSEGLRLDVSCQKEAVLVPFYEKRGFARLLQENCDDSIGFIHFFSEESADYEGYCSQEEEDDYGWGGFGGY
jgi:GNAT superfamily N-acetyltransferase